LAATCEQFHPGSAPNARNFDFQARTTDGGQHLKLAALTTRKPTPKPASPNSLPQRPASRHLKLKPAAQPPTQSDASTPSSKARNKNPNLKAERNPPPPAAIAQQTPAQASALPLKLPRGNSVRLKMPSMVKFRHFPIPAFLCTCRFLRPFPDSCAIAARFEWKRLSGKMACGISKPV
jgi:hypothetical protein